MKNTLIDTGPCIALFDRNDKHHHRVKSFLKTFTGNLTTSWPVVTETLHMLDFSVQVQIDFMRWIHRGALVIATLTTEDLERIMALSDKYKDLPMDFADATLLVIAEKENIKDVITLDSDFRFYRINRDQMLNDLLA